jgi:NAD+ synthase (glutamine-hydrolysing)
MRNLRVALAQMNTIVGGLEENADRMIDLIDRAQQAGADIVAFPEMAITGYPPEDLVLKPEFIRDNLHELERIAAAVGDITAVVGFVDTDGEDIYNAAAVIQQGKVIGVHHKFYLPNYSVFDEQRYFRAGSEWTVFTIRGVKVGVTICEDIWYPIGPGALEALSGAEVILNINASPYRCGKYDQRYRMVSTRAMDELTYVCYLNTVGGQDELLFEGASMIFDQDGTLLLRGTFFQEEFLLADLDIDTVFNARLHDARRRQSVVRADELLDAPGRVVETPLAGRSESRANDPLPQHLCRVPEPLEEIYHALVLGTHDYVRKSGFKQVIIGLSGGIDSSLTAAVAVDALGADSVLGVSNPSRYSSEGSRTDAQELADNLGIRLLKIPIEDIFAAYLLTLEGPFAGREMDLTEENIQARIRGNIWMALTNKFGGIVLTAGNKSEMAVGYSTLYGDMAGGFSVLKDVYKTTVYELAAYKNTVAGRDIIPRAVLEKAPSAELRPDQRDQDSLPPYDVLDRILKLYVEEDYSASDIVARGFDPEVVTRVINLVDHNEYKRRQAPPGIKISVRAFGKDRRLPIANHYRDLPQVGDSVTLERVAREAEDEVQARSERGRAAR